MHGGGRCAYSPPQLGPIPSGGRVSGTTMAA